MAWFIGIDIGSTTTKGVITKDGRLEAYHLIPSGSNYLLAAQTIRDELLAKVNLPPAEIVYTVTTGHGADTIPFSYLDISDIRCCARGINRIFPTARTVIDVQGQSSQTIRLNEKGQVVNFAISEKCAAGSGRFLDIIARVLQIALKDIGPLSLKSANPVIFTTGCAVFGESEVISRIAEGISKEDILAGVNKALADKLANLLTQVGLEEPCVISGGGALNIGLIKKLEEKLGTQLLVPPQPQLVNALGAVIIAEEEMAKAPLGKPFSERPKTTQWESWEEEDEGL